MDFTGKKVLIAGGAGFIGSALVRLLITETDHSVLVVDKLTYAGNLDSLSSVAANRRYSFLRADICDAPTLTEVVDSFAPDLIIHLAAESHVDRSIEGPSAFFETNIFGTFTLLQIAHSYWRKLPAARRKGFRFHHISTDEVFGSLPQSGYFDETSPYDPRSPYSATKAASDHLVNAWHHTYGLPVLTTNCSNNYGPYQFPEKLIPLMILNATQSKPLPIYGDGMNVRDWLYVTDHCSAIRTVLQGGRLGETYNIGGWNEMPNIEIVKIVCALLDEMHPDKTGPYARLLNYVKDRPGHDRRYAIDASKIHRELGWKPAETFETGIRKTVRWYLDNMDWVENVASGEYRKWLDTNYLERSAS